MVMAGRASSASQGQGVPELATSGCETGPPKPDRSSSLLRHSNVYLA